VNSHGAFSFRAKAWNFAVHPRFSHPVNEYYKFYPVIEIDDLPVALRQPPE
jgi:hypothetical protein